MDFLQGTLDFFTDLLNTIICFLRELFVWLVDIFLIAVASVIDTIPVPDFFSDNNMQALTANLDPSIVYFLGQSGLPEGMALLGAGLTFRLLRKIFTLGQW